MGWSATGQLEKALEPIASGLTKAFDIRPRVGATDGCTDADGDNVRQQVPSVVVLGILQVREVMCDRRH